MTNLSNVLVKFSIGDPFKPLQQLVAVLPPQSIHLLPSSYGDLIVNKQSRLHEFYPAKFEVDMNDKKTIGKE